MSLGTIRLTELPLNSADAVRELYDRADHRTDEAFDRAFHAPTGRFAEFPSNTFEPLS